MAACGVSKCGPVYPGAAVAGDAGDVGAAAGAAVGGWAADAGCCAARTPTAYVVSNGGPLGTARVGSVTPISTATNRPGKPIRLGFFPFRIAITSNGKTAYATSDSGLTPINTATNTPGKAIKGLSGPIAITPDGTTVYAGSSNHTVTPVNTATNRPGKAITVGSDPVAIAITP